MADAELERFKTGINLSEFAASWGYVLNRRESSQNSAVMEHPDGDKIVIARQEGGAWVYFSVRDDGDHGTVIEFWQKRTGKNLGQARKALRAWSGAARPPVPVADYVGELFPVERNRAAVLAAWTGAQACVALPYLSGRGLGPDVLGLPIFAGCVRVDKRHNALFPHFDREGLCGFEIKNRDFTGFAAGGTKGLWHSKARTTDRRLVLTESAIDAISFHVLQGDASTRYMSTGGSLNPQQPALIRGAMEKLPPGGIVLLAFDNDDGGEKLAQEVRAFAPSGRDVRRILPDTGKDWNEALKARLGLT